MLSFRSAYFANESPRRLNKNILIDRLATRLQIAANGRILFVDREHADMVEKERALTREGVADAGTAGLARGRRGGLPPERKNRFAGLVRLRRRYGTLYEHSAPHDRPVIDDRRMSYGEVHDGDHGGVCLYRRVRVRVGLCAGLARLSRRRAD